MLCLLLTSLLSISPDTLPPDGPYLFYDGSALLARWVDTETRQQGELKIGDPKGVDLPTFPTFRPELLRQGAAFPMETNLIFDQVTEVAALSDIHGQYETGRKLLEVNGVIDADQHWSFGKGHLVIVGDVFDRGDQVTELLWLIHNLQLEAERAGGRVHFLLGNHETMTLQGDDRYLNDRYRITSGTLGKLYKDLYGPDTYLGRWLRSLPLAVRINGTVYIHGGLSKDMVRQESSLDRINDLYHHHLIDNERLQDMLKSNHKLETLHGRMGPLWYRGYFSRNKFDAEDLDYILRKVGAQRIVVGHTSFTAIQGFYNNRLIAVDSSIKFGGTGELLMARGEELFRATLLGKLIPLDDAVTK